MGNGRTLKSGGDESKGLLTHESLIYEHMQREGTEGVPSYFGLFHDYEGGPSVLVLGLSGKALCTIEEFEHPDYEEQFLVESPYRCDISISFIGF